MTLKKVAATEIVWAEKLISLNKNIYLTRSGGTDRLNTRCRRTFRGFI